MTPPLRRILPLLGTSLLAALAAGPSPARAGTDALVPRARQTLLQILAGKTGWEEMHAAEALVACGDGEAVRRRYAAEAAAEPAPYRTNVWRLLALSATDAAERRGWISRMEEVVRDPGATDRFTAAEVLCKLHHRLNGPALEQARRMAADSVLTHSLFGQWALAVREEPGALEAIAGALRSRDPAARALAASILRWLRPDDAGVLAGLARAADAEPLDSPGFPSVVGAAVILNADPGRRAAWRSGLEEIVRRGPGRPRWAACQALMLGDTAADAAKVARFLDAPDPDSRTGAAWTILHLEGGARPKLQDSRG